MAIKLAINFKTELSIMCFPLEFKPVKTLLLQRRELKTWRARGEKTENAISNRCAIVSVPARNFAIGENQWKFLGRMSFAELIPSESLSPKNAIYSLASGTLAIICSLAGRSFFTVPPRGTHDND